jgi:hypothetical protein
MTAITKNLHLCGGLHFTISSSSDTILMMQQAGYTSNSNNSNNNNNSFSSNSLMDQSQSSSRHSYEAENGIPFFADMTLDLAEAHDIAETPEPLHRTLFPTTTQSLQHQQQQFPTLPSLSEYNSSNQNLVDNFIVTNNNNINNNGDNEEMLLSTPLSRISRLPPQQQQQQHLPLSSATTTSTTVSATTTTTAVAASMSSSSSSPPVPQHDDNNYNPQDDTVVGVMLDRNMERVTANDTNNKNSHHPGFLRGLATRRSSNHQHHRRRRRQWPKDVSWAIAFILIVPITLLFPIWFAGTNNSNNNNNENNNKSEIWIATGKAPKLATLHTIFWGLGVAIVLSRLLYRTAGGGDGDDARHLASQFLLASAPISVSVFLMLIVAIKIMTPHAFWPYAIIPFWYLARDIYLFRRWNMTATTPGGRQAFFQALSCMTLDILSRSLRRNACWRMIVSVLLVQFFVIMLWRVSLLAAIQSQSLIWILMATMGGKWATGTVARMLSLVACGGISNWFAEQSVLVEEMNNQLQQQQHQQQTKKDKNNNLNSRLDNVDDEDTNDEEMIEFTDMSTNQRLPAHSLDDLPEAYRSVDASAYTSVLQNEGMEDDDFYDEHQQGEDDIDLRSYPTNSFTMSPSRQPKHSTSPPNSSRTTVKQFLMAGLSINFGSVAKCGLLGGVAQFVWSQIRKIDHARAAFRRGGGNMQGMDIGGGPDDDQRAIGRISHVKECCNNIIFRMNFLAREFVRSHSDMAMSFVADYKLSYTRAAQDVALLLDEAGVEPILHDDISTHMSACVGGSVSGLIVLFTGAVLTHHRNRNSPHVLDSAIVLDMLMAFYFCYTLIFTVMEPLRASIKAVYVCFAQHPESLSQAFPLIFHRLTRMSQSNLQ